MLWRRHTKISLTTLISAASVFIISSHRSAIDFNAEIKQIINKSCVSCNGVKRQAKKLLPFQNKSNKLNILLWNNIMLKYYL